jgi:hypothetical protein
MTPTDQPLGAHHYTDEEMHNEDIGHEHSDVNVRTLLSFATALLVVVAIAAALMYGLFVVLEKQAEARDPQVSPFAVAPGQAPQGPKLLTNEPANLRQFRQEEAGKLEGYGWMSQGSGIAHVPIDLAKKLVVEHGLPVRADAPADDKLGTHAPAYGESSGGRTIPVKHAAPAAPPAGSEQPPTTAPHAAPPAGQEIKK